MFKQYAVDSQKGCDVWIVSGTLITQVKASPTSKREARRPLKSVESLLSALPCLWASLSAQISISTAIRAFSQPRFPSCSSASFLSSCTQQKSVIQPMWSSEEMCFYSLLSSAAATLTSTSQVTHHRGDKEGTVSG